MGEQCKGNDASQVPFLVILVLFSTEMYQWIGQIGMVLFSAEKYWLLTPFKPKKRQYKGLNVFVDKIVACLGSLMLPKVTTPSHLEQLLSQISVLTNKIEFPEILPFSFPCR